MALLLAACGGNPFQKGEKLADKYDACMAEYNQAQAKTGEEFANKIPGRYNSRAKAMEDYLQALTACHQEYLGKWKEIAAEEQETRERIRSTADRVEFENGLQSNRDFFTFASVPDMANIEVPPAVLQQVRNINPPKPDAAQIARDLVGHTLSEGKEEGYYPQSWTWRITEGGISDVQILSTQENTDSRYTVTVSMKLSSETRAYDAKAIVSYKLGDVSDWEIEYVRSQGLDIVRTHRYDDCVRVDYRSGFLTIDNLCDMAVEVGGKYFQLDKWNVFRVVVPPHGTSYPSRDGYSVLDVIIDYKERP